MIFFDHDRIVTYNIMFWTVGVQRGSLVLPDKLLHAPTHSPIFFGRSLFARLAIRLGDNVISVFISILLHMIGTCIILLCHIRFHIYILFQV